MLLAKHGYFSRLFELKNKFRHLPLEDPREQNIVRQLSRCINKKYNGFHVIRSNTVKKLRKKFKLIDAIYKPVKSPGKTFSVTTLKIDQNHTEILPEIAKRYCMGLPLSAIIVESFLQELTNKEDALKIVLVFPE